MKNFIQHVVYSHREGLRWYFKSTERKGTFVISLYPWDIRLLKYGLYLLIPPLKETHIKGTGIKKGMPTQQSWRSARNCKFRVSD